MSYYDPQKDDGELKTGVVTILLIVQGLGIVSAIIVALAPPNFPFHLLAGGVMLVFCAVNSYYLIWCLRNSKVFLRGWSERVTSPFDFWLGITLLSLGSLCFLALGICSLLGVNLSFLAPD